MYISIPTYKNGEGWSVTNFETIKEYSEFVKSRIKKVGSYELFDTHIFREAAIEFEKHGYYTKLTYLSKPWIEYWDNHRNKSKVGAIINGFLLTPHYYFYLNFTPIYNVIEQKTTFAEVWDTHYDYCLHSELARLQGKYMVTTKKRRVGFSLLEVSDIHRIFLFERDSISKFIHREEGPSKANFQILSDYRMFTDTYTAWTRPITGSFPEIIQRIEQVDTITKQKSYSGYNSIVQGVITRQNPAKGVGRYATKLFYDEFGLNGHGIKSIQYNEKAIKQGGLVKGRMVVGGSVGELKDAEDLKELMYNPDKYGFYFLDNEFGEKRGFFIPEQWSYVQEVRDEDDIVTGYIKYYDKDGNSDIDNALVAIHKKRLEEKGKSAQAYRLSISQGPTTLEECFDTREENLFPTHIIQEPYNKLISVKSEIGTPVELFLDNQGKIKHKFVDNTKVNDWPIKKDTPTNGCIIVYEFPMQNAPMNLYFAGVDTVGTKKMSLATSDSLMSCYIVKGVHSIEGELNQKEIVAEYTGRFDNFEQTYNTVTMLWEWYNARPLIENNNENYIQWLITHKKQRMLIRSDELSNLKEINVNYSSLSNYGINVTPKLKEYLRDLVIEYIENPITKQFNDKTAEVTNILGVHKIKDYMLLKEMLGWSSKVNCDRIDALSMALWAVRVFNEMGNRKVIKKENNGEPPKPMTRWKQSMFNKSRSNMFNNKIKMF